MAQYGPDLARIHHEGFPDIAAAAGPAIVSWLRAAGIRSGLVIDLGCGSGILARHVLAHGYDVLGIDASAPMLRLARRVAPQARFRLSRAEDAALPACAAVVATGEAITYLTGRRGPDALLRHHVRRIARALRPGGLFIFDAIVKGPRMQYRTWRASASWAVLVDVTEDVRMRIVTREHTTFVQAGARFRRREALHRVGVYSPRMVRALLAAHGFSVSTHRGYGRTPLLPRRRVFVARLGVAAR